MSNEVSIIRTHLISSSESLKSLINFVLEMLTSTQSCNNELTTFRCKGVSPSLLLTNEQ